MSWQKKDDNFHDSPKVVAASLSYAELGMYDYAVGYSHRHLTDGLVPRDQLIYRVSWEMKQNFQASVAAAERLLQRLLDVCFFAERPDGYIQIVGYLDNYESKADVEEARERLSEIRAEAGRRGGIASGQSKREASSKANVQSKKAEASPQRSEPNLTDPNLTSPHRGESPQSSPPTPEKSDAYTRARPTEPTPEPGGSAKARVAPKQSEPDGPVVTPQEAARLAEDVQALLGKVGRQAPDPGDIVETNTKRAAAFARLRASGLSDNDGVHEAQNGASHGPPHITLAMRREWAAKGLNPDTGEPFGMAGGDGE